MTVKTEHGKLDFVEEYANLRQIIPVVTSKIEVTEGKVMVDFAGVSEEDVTKICDVLKNIQSVKIILPVGFEYLCYAVESGDFEGVEINLSGIKEIDINKENSIFNGKLYLIDPANYFINNINDLLIYYNIFLIT